MEKILIKDSRLTPTMERTRNGSTQMFRERNRPYNRGSIGSENFDVTLKHENKEMYAELIEDKWYWVSGCSECNGEPRGKSYIECEKHDVCKCCGTSRKEFEGAVWGGTKGWTCKPCEEKRMLSIRKEAFEKLDGEEPDTSYTDKIICPHCGSINSNSEIHESQKLECYVCDGEFSLEVEYTVSYSTTVIGKRKKK